MATKNPIRKYLKSYAEKEASSLAGHAFHSQLKATYCVVVPVFDETSRFITRLENHTNAAQTLCIVVINQAENTNIHPANQELWDWFVSRLANSEQHAQFLFGLLGKLKVLVVDRFTPFHQIPKKQGVGLARKIGADIATHLFSREIITTPWLYSTDADAHLPENYFCSLPPGAGAVFFDFQHKDDGSNVANATRTYEASLKYYREALAWAGSPYAFYSLGSTIAVNFERYCVVRGFPKRAGGEDFYVLNKLAKVAPVHFCQEVKIELEARISQRVPFGTGPAVEKITRLDHISDYTYYDPEIFIALNSLLTWLREAAHKPWPPIESSPSGHGIAEALAALNFQEFIDHAQQHCSSPEKIEEHFHAWFDGFRTLKFIHFLQNNFFPPLPLSRCLDRFSELR